MESIKKPLIVICGPTASGKSSIAVSICKSIDGEVVSADSMQLYKGMDILTAKISQTEQCGIKHHLLDIFEPNENVSVSMYADLAKETINDIHNRGKIPVLCGGTGLYIDAVTKHMSFSSPADMTIRNELKKISETPDGSTKLHMILEEEDPEAASLIHPNDIRRIIRAIESKRITGLTKAQLSAKDVSMPGDYHEILLEPYFERNVLYERIEDRVDDMLRRGLIQEVCTLVSKGIPQSCTAAQAIGYKESVRYINGEIDYESAVESIKQASRNYAKRQETWFRHDGRVHFIPAKGKTSEEIAGEMVSVCRREGVI